MRRRAEQNKIGLSRNQSSIMPDMYVVSSSLNLRMNNSGTSSKTLVESWKFRCQQQCLANTPLNSIGKRTTKYACIVDADETMRVRLESAPHRYHGHHICAKGINSLNHYNLVHKFIPMPRALKIPDAKQQWKKNRKSWRNTGMADTKLRNKKEVIEEARKKGRKVHFASLMDLCHLKNSELGQSRTPR